MPRPDLFSTPPFRRAPLLLLKHRIVFLAVLGASIILGLVVALTPQFLSSAASEALQRDLGGRCDASYAGSLQPRRSFGGFIRFPGVTAENRERLSAAIAGQENLKAPRATIKGRTLGMRPNGAPAPTFNMSFFHRTGWEDRVTTVRGEPGSGVSIDEYTSEVYDIDVGDTLAYRFTVELSNMRTKDISGEIVVGSVHEDLVGSTGLDFWCDVNDLIGLSPAGDRLTPVGMVDIAVFGDGVISEFEDPPDEWFLRADQYWVLPVDLEDLTLSTAYEVIETFTGVGQEIMSTPEGLRSDLEQVSDRVTQIHSALASSVQPLSTAVVVVALALMAGAGSYWVDRRSDELRLLSAYGAGPVLIGRKAALEMLIPIAVGVALGALLSTPTANLVGPGGAVESQATWDSFFLALPTIFLALGLVGVVAALRSKQLLGTRRRSRFSGWWLLPVAVLLLVAAWQVRTAVGDEAVRFGENELVGFVDPRVVLFPLLFFAAVALVGAILFVAVARRAKGRKTANPMFLALRRITSSPGPVIVLIAGALIPIATLVYSAALTRAADQSVQTKGRVFIGSDIRAPVYGFDGLPPELIDESTYVRKADRVDFGETEVDLLVVDADTFETGAFWADSFSDQSLESLLSEIDEIGTPLLAIAAGGGLAGEARNLDMPRYDMPVRVIRDLDVFPGMRGSRPILIVERRSFEAFTAELDLPQGIDGTDRYLWTKIGNTDAVELALGRSDIGFSFTTSVGEALDLTKFQVIIWTFDFLELYAAFAGIIVVGAVVLYADTRQRHRNLSYALVIRMGLTRREHLVAGFIEFGAILLAGGVLGSVAAYLPARSIYWALDALPLTPPAPAWIGVGDVAIVLAVASLGVGFVAAYVAQRTADNADVSELLRHGG